MFKIFEFVKLIFHIFVFTTTTVVLWSIDCQSVVMRYYRCSLLFWLF